MHQITVSVENAHIILDFYIQKRRTDGMHVMRDTICVGRYISDFGEKLYIPVVTYQSVKDNYDRMRGIEEVLKKFMRHNAIVPELRKLIWDKFRDVQMAYDVTQDGKAKHKAHKRLMTKVMTPTKHVVREASALMSGKATSPVADKIKVDEPPMI